jgi:hypothetical protein
MILTIREIDQNRTASRDAFDGGAAMSVPREPPSGSTRARGPAC